MLNNYNIDRRHALVTNACLCRPANNATPGATEIDACAPRLRAEIDSSGAPQILALGNTASQAVLGEKIGITKQRVGPPKKSPLYPDKEVVATFHPAACLRAADFFPHLVSDVGKLRDRNPIRFQEPTYKVFDTPAEATMVLDEITHKFQRVYIDVEIGIDKDEVFDSATDKYQLLCVGIGYADHKVVVIGEQALRYPGVQAALKRLLQTCEISAHNGKFDTAALSHITLADLKFDTMLANYQKDERPRIHGLEYRAIEELGAPDWKSEIKRYLGKEKNYALIPRDVLYKYNAFDVACGWLLEKRDRERLATDGEGQYLHDFLVAAGNEIRKAEMAGVAVDIPYLDMLTEEYLKVLEALEISMRDNIGLQTFNPRSPQQVKKYLHEHQGIQIPDTTKDTLAALLEKVDPVSTAAIFLQDMLRHRREQKLYGTYVKGIRKRLYRGRVHSTFLLHGTTTGRLASRNPNLQNIPRESKIRKMFVPAPGNVFVQGDYATIELRVLDVEAQDPFLRDIFLTGKDIHDTFSLQFYGEGFTKDQRVRTKAFVYGLSYGREEYSIALEFGIPLVEARNQMQQFFDMMPGVVAWREEIKRSVLEEQNDLVTHFGRHRRFWLITNDNMKDVLKEALAFKPQSTASDINLHAFIRLSRDYKLQCRIPVHDSILVECPAREANDVGALMKEVMESTAREVYSDYVPFPVDIEIGDNWGELTKGKYQPLEGELVLTDEENQEEVLNK